ncbi:MAG: HTH-type transcriptional regulator MntR [Eubacteriales bacterium SKADARSKE-1]|nr:HTH-type transcriptional regulator MntR [Eubacteriales bacterium SKADARSKE-1]
MAHATETAKVVAVGTGEINMEQKNKLTGSLEDYLESIYILKKNKGEVRLTDIALEMECSKPSASKAILSLRKEKLVIQEKYGLISLTPEGDKAAENICFRHRTLVNFLTNTLGVNSKTAQKDACKMEHVISPETLDRLVSYMKK